MPARSLTASQIRTPRPASRFAPLPLVAALAVVLAWSGEASASFVISNASTTAQTLGTAANQTGVINLGSSLTVSGSTNAVTISGNNASLTNLGTLRQAGTGRAIRDNTGVSGLVVTNGSSSNSTALIQTADADVIQMNVAGGSVMLHNYGTMSSLNASAGGAQAIDFAAIATGSNTVNNYATGLLRASEADAVRTGVNGVVNNWGSILAVTSTGSSSDGIDLQSNAGAQINNYLGGSVTGGRHGITGGATSASVSFASVITNGGTITGSNGSGLNFDGFNANQVITVTNSGSIFGTGNTGDGDGIDIDGLINLNNSGVIRSFNAVASGGTAYSEGLTVGGGTIVNTGTIEGLVAAGNTNARGRGITLAGNDITTGPLAGTREAIYGHTTITNQYGGLIRGQNDSAIVVEGPASGYTVTINNHAGATLRGGSTTDAAIRTGFDADTLINRGLIDGASSGRAVDLGGGNNVMQILGGQAVVLGNINGGTGGTNTLVMHPGTGNAFSYNGALSNFASVDVQSGTVTLSGINSYTGATLVSGGTLVLDGANRLSSASALHLNGGTLQIANAAAANGQVFSSLMLLATSAIDLDGSALTFGGLGTVANGAALSVFDFVPSAGTTYALRFLGNLSNDASFLAFLSTLNINGQAANYHFDGTFTEVSAVPLPAAAWLFLSGLGVVGAAMRRRRAMTA